MTIEVRRSVPADLPGILALMRQQLGWPSDQRAEALWRWKHEQGPFGPSPVWVAADGDHVIALRAFLRWRLRTATGDVVNAVRAVDTATAATHQGQGWFRRLTLHGLEELASEGVSLVFNTPNDQSRPGYLSMGWVEIDRPRVWIRPSSFASLLALRGGRTSAELWPAPCSVGTMASEGLADASLDALVGSSSGARGSALRTERSVEYLRWRYGHPALGYRVLATGAGRSGLGDGFVVFRSRQRGTTVERSILDVVGRPDAWRGAVADRSGFDVALALGHRPGRLWVPVPRSGPRLVVRPIGGTDAFGPLDLSLGDVEFF